METKITIMHSAMDSGASMYMDAMPFGILMLMNENQHKSGV